MIVSPMFDPVTEDTPITDGEKDASLVHLSIPSAGTDMLGTMFSPSGEGPHPLAIVLHGFPGHEKNLDIAHALRRAGFCSVVFHYRGSWGSRGNFTFGNMLRDIGSAVDHFTSNSLKYDMDPSSITLIGHSMGGWGALVHGAKDPRVGRIVVMAPFDLGIVKDFAAVDDISRILVLKGFEESLEPLNGATPEGLLSEVIENGDGWKLTGSAGALAGKKLMVIGALRDTTAPPELNIAPLVEALKAAGASHFAAHELDSDHNFSDGRVRLTRIILDWLQKDD